MFWVALGQDQVAEMILLEKVSLDEGDRRISEGDGSGHLVIPQGFGKAWLDREEIALQLTVNPSQSISPRLIREMLESLLDLGDYLHKVFGGELKIISQSIDGDGLVGITTAEFSADITDKVSGIADLVFPPVVEVEDVTPRPEGSSLSMGLLMFPGILIMAAVFSRTKRCQNLLPQSHNTPRGCALYLAGPAAGQYRQNQQSGRQFRCFRFV